MGSEWTLGRLSGGCGVDSIGSGYGLLAGSCECGDIRIKHEFNNVMEEHTEDGGSMFLLEFGFI
jgi:hypothetical protein